MQHASRRLPLRSGLCALAGAPWARGRPVRYGMSRHVRGRTKSNEQTTHTTAPSSSRGLTYQDARGRTPRVLPRVSSLASVVLYKTE
eukprot:1740375-Prymnesium_polylepis.2